MWLLRIFRLSDPAVIVPIRSAIESNMARIKLFPNSNARLLHCSRLNAQGKSQYEYDPKSDSFRPKDQVSYTYSNNQKQNGQEQDNHKYFTSFLKRFAQNLFLITGGVVWVGAIFVSLFVDVKEEEFTHNIKDFDDEVRLLAFYDIGQSKTDLAKMMSKDSKHSNEMQEIHLATNLKQISFLNTVKWIQEQDAVIESLGAPVHLCGFRASEKINRMIKSFQHLAEHGIKEHLKDDKRRTTWKAECILEGTKAIGLLILEFEASDDDSAWNPVYLKVTRLDSHGEDVIEKMAILPGDLKLSETT